MLAEHTPGRSRAPAVYLLAAASLCALLTAAPATFAMALCTLEPSVVFAYPGIDTEATIPRNAQPLFVVAGSLERPALVWLSDNYRASTLREIPFDRFRIDVADRLTPGRHEVDLILDEATGSRLVGPESYTLRFNVADELAPAPDEVGSVAITRVLRYRRRVGGVLRADHDAGSVARQDPADCSLEVSIQAGCGGGRGWSALTGEYRVELEAEGPVLGYALNDRYFLPAHCRSAFVWESGPYDIRVVTEAGLGAVTEYTGEIESEVSSDPDPLAAPEKESLIACSVASRGGSPPCSGALWAALLAGVIALRRGRRARLEDAAARFTPR